MPANILDIDRRLDGYKNYEVVRDMPECDERWIRQGALLVHDKTGQIFLSANSMVSEYRRVGFDVLVVRNNGFKVYVEDIDCLEWSMLIEGMETFLIDEISYCRWFE